MTKLITLLFIGFGFSSIAQNSLFLTFSPKNAGVDLVLNTNIQDLNGVVMKVDDFNYYISNIHIIYDGGQDLDYSDTVLLVTATANTFKLDNIDVPNIEQINFGVGVPEAINHLDISLYPEDHFLSWQTPSMHWGWTSGYKCLLVDAWGDGTGDGNPESVFQLHNLGDANYKNVQLPVVGTYTPTQTDIFINCNLDEWIYGANPGTTGALHGTTGLNASTMNNVNSRVVFEQPATAGVTELNTNSTLFFTNAGTNLTVTWKDMTGIASYQLIDMSGRIIIKENTSLINNSISISNPTKGSYIFTAFDENGRILNTINVVH